MKLLPEKEMDQSIIHFLSGWDNGTMSVNRTRFPRYAKLGRAGARESC